MKHFGWRDIKNTAVIVGTGLAVLFAGQIHIYANDYSQDTVQIQEVQQMDRLEQFEEHIEYIDDSQITEDTYTKKIYANESEWTQYSSDYYYNQLTSDEKILYDRLEAVALYYINCDDNITNIKFENEFYLDNVDCQDLEITSERAKFVTELFYQSESQYFFLRNAWSFSKSLTTGKVKSVSIAVYDMFADGQIRLEYAQQLQKQILAWSNIIEREDTNYLKQKKIHDLICENFAYQSGDYDQSVISGLLDYGIFHRQTVCAGYAKAFQIMSNAAGLQSIIVVSESHAWNCIFFDGNWFCVDTTYDCNLYPFGLSDYLDISTDRLLEKDQRDRSRTHTVSRLWKVYQPECKYNYAEEVDNVQWNIGKNIVANYDGNGTLIIHGEGSTYSYEMGESPLEHTMYAAVFNKLLIEDGITDIGDYIFANGTFQIVVLPESLKKISSTAFCQSNKIEQIINESSIENDLSDLFGEQEQKYIWYDADTQEEVTSLQNEGMLLREEVDISKNGVLADGKGNWYYYVEGIVDRTYNGVESNEYGWWKITNGAVDFTFNGLASNDYGYWKIVNGAVDFGYNGLASDKIGWWKITNGAVDYAYSGLIGNEAGWWKITGGAVDFGYNGLVDNEAGWWKITNGMVDFGYDGLVNNEYGWWKVTDGRVDFNYTGITNNEAGWWKVTNGAVDFDYTGLASNEVGWWKITNGAVDFTFTGIADNEAGWWYITDGLLDFTYSGLVEYDNIIYQIEDGKVIG